MKDKVKKTNTARNTPPNLLITKLINMAQRRMRRYYVKFLLVRLSDKQNFKPTDNRKLNEQSAFFVGSNDRDEIVKTIKGKYPETIEQIINDANEICKHHFAFLGSDKTDLGKNIDWHKDFKSGTSWDSNILFTDTEIIKGKNSDIKVPWELSRFIYLPTLGKAYYLTRDKKYANEFISELNDWIDKNPPFYGVNWTCTMEVAIRAVNWIWGYYFFKDSPELDEEFLSRFLQSLYIHGRYIRANLEHNSRLKTFAGSIIRRHPKLNVFKPGWHEPTNNHYLSDIVGLIYLGLLFPEFKEAKKWREFGIRELIKEMRGQVYSDGVDYEGTISYHRLVCELFVSATLLRLKNGVIFPEWYIKRLENMMEFTMYYSKPDGTAPQIGDNDDGRLHILANYGDWNRRDHRYLLSIGAVMFNRPDFKQASGEFHEEAFWLLGSDGLSKYNELPEQQTGISSKVFTLGGYYIMRKENLYMIVDCIPADSEAPSGHKHNSRLSFELYAYDKSFILDPGAYIYSADVEMRYLFRSTQYHNTVVVDGEEQNKLIANELWIAEPGSVVKVNQWQSNEKQDILVVEHDGYKRLKNPVIHSRQFFFDKTDGYWLIKDILSGEGTHQCAVYFHLAPMELEIEKEFPLAIKTRTRGANLAIIPLGTEGIALEILKGYVSYQYGVKVEAPIVKYVKSGYLPMSFYNIVYPHVAEININEIIEKAKTLHV